MTHTTSPNNVDAERALVEAVRKLAKAKGRYHTEQNYKALTEALEGYDAARRSPVADAAGELPPIEYDQDMQRTYLPLPGGWEIQTKGKGSSFRIANAKPGYRWIVMDDQLHEVLEAMARDVRNAFNAARQSAPEGAPVGMDDPYAYEESDGDTSDLVYAAWFQLGRGKMDPNKTYEPLYRTAPTSASAQPKGEGDDE